MKKYHVRTSIDNLEKLNHFRIIKLKTVDDKLEFFCYDKDFKSLSQMVDLEYTDLFKQKTETIFKKHLITILGLILIFLAIINQSKTINRIEFINPDTHNPEIIDYLEKYFKKIGPFNYLTADLTEINFDLKSEFFNYEWIAISRQGAILYVDIKKLTNNPPNVDNRPGSVYASHSGIIKRYHISKGLVLVQEEVYVTKGDMLISGVITHLDNSTSHVRASGYVIAEVLDYYDFRVPKVTENKMLSGRMISQKEYSLLSWKLNTITNEFDNQVIIEETEKSFLGIFKTKKVYIYEEIIIKSIYEKDDAISYAKSMVRKDFRSTKVNEFEKIVFNDLVRITEDKEYFYVRLIVKSHRNIAQFIESQHE